jgi:hypothetical protein
MGRVVRLEVISLLRVLFATRLVVDRLRLWYFYVLKEIFVVDLEVPVFEFPCQEVSTEMRQTYPFSIRTYTTVLIAPHLMKIISTNVSSYFEDG